MELLNTKFDASTPNTATYFRAPTGQRVRSVICGSEGATIFPTGPSSSLTWSMSNIPAFTEIYVKFRIGFIDSWKGEKATISINGVSVWTQASTSDQLNHNIFVCGKTTQSDEFETVERRLRLSGPASALSVVISSTKTQPGISSNPSDGFWILSQFVVYALGGNGAALPVNVNGAIVNNNAGPAKPPPPPGPVYQTVYKSAFVAGVDSGWVDKFNRAVLPYACGTQGLTIRQGTSNYLQITTPAVSFAFNRIRLTLSFGFIDSWDGEAGIITVKGQEVWRQTSAAPAIGASAASITASGHTSQICGMADRPPRTFDRFVTVVREMVMAAPPDRRIVVNVKSTLDQSIDDESFVISNVQIEVSP